MTQPRVVDPADSELFERQEAALLRWTEELRGKQRLFAERECVFVGTRLALGGPRGSRVLPPAASPASEHSPQRVGVTGQALAARSLATPLLARPPAASLSSLSASPRHSGYTSHLGSTEATAPEAQLFTPAASSSRRKRRTRRHNTDHFEQLPVTVKLKTVNSGGRKTRTIPDKPVSITHPVTISTPITQPFPASTAAQIRSYSSTVSPSQVKTAKAQPVPTTPPQMARAQPATTPVPAPRTRAAVTQSTSTPAPVSRVGVTGVQPPPVPVPAPRLRAARTQPDLARGLEQLTSPPATSPRHPPPDPAFHALALSLVRLAEVSHAQAPALLAQAVALSPSLAQSLAQPVATPTSAQSLGSPTSVHPLASPVQSAHSPAVQPPAQSVQSAVAQSPPVLRSPVAQSPPVLRSPVAQSPPVLRSPVAQSPPVLRSPVAQSPPVLRSPVAQSPLAHQGFPRPLARPVSSQGFPRPLARPVSSQGLPRLLVLQLLFHHRRLPCRRLVQPQLQLQPLLRLVQLLPLRQPRLVLRLPRHRPSHVLDVIAGVVDHRTCSVAAAVFLAAAHQITSSVTAGHVAACQNCLCFGLRRSILDPLRPPCLGFSFFRPSGAGL
ncbi:unnamed protein product [Oreochromis niloticus]|nr:unnamed protein product [Mustela putorius furo]